MEVYIPVADVTLTNEGTYDGQLPVWSTRPLMITCKPDFISSVGYDLHIDVISGGAVVKSISFPYSVSIDVDASFAALLLPRADRNKSQYIPECWLRVWSQSVGPYIKIPVFHADLTYWHTLGNQSSLPQPAKPRIPGQTLDIFYPKRTQQQAADAYNVVAEPVTGYPSTVIFPTKYILGKTIDISYIKKLTIKDYPSAGLTYDINYEDRLPSSATEDASLQCALRARWNMQNGQWFWAAFKDYYWTNKFTTIRGRGGVTDQATVTVNLEYGREWYTVYQQLLTSSNIVFDLMIDGINQYSDKQFRAEVVGDKGARWNNASKLYRQQVQFRTTELQDNYPLLSRPDTPETPAITFRAQVNPWRMSAGYFEGRWNNITANADWEVQSKPGWFSFGHMLNLTATDFEQGGVTWVASGSTYESMKTTSNAFLRSKTPIVANGKTVLVRAFVPGYSVVWYTFDSNMKALSGSSAAVTSGSDVTVIIPAGQFVVIRLAKNPRAVIVPSEATAAQIGISDNSIYTRMGKAGVEYIFGTVASNPNSTNRNGTIVLKSKAGSTTFNLPVMQAGATGNITATPSTISAGYVHLPVTVSVTSFGTWSVSASDEWITPSLFAGADGTTNVVLTIDGNTETNDPRTGSITFYNELTEETAVVTVNQDGAPSDIGLRPSEVTGPASAGNVTKTLLIISTDNWIMDSGPSWVAITPTSGAPSQISIAIKYDTPNTGAARAGLLKIRNTTTGSIAVAIIRQEGV